MTPTTATDPLAAHRAVQDAEERIAKAKQARDEALERLDVALAKLGWRRAGGAFTPGDAPLYSRLGSNLVTQREVLADIERQVP